MFKTGNDLPEKTRDLVCALLNSRLADAIDLWLQAKQAHWTVRGPHFIALHELFDKVAEEVEADMDMIAERVEQLGGMAHGTVQAAAKHTSLTPYGLDTVEGMAHVIALSRGLAEFSKHLRKDIARCTQEQDAGSADLLTEVSRDAEKYLWFVESHLNTNAA